MGFGSIPDIAYQFIAAVGKAPPYAKHVAGKVYDSGMNVVVGATDPDAMPSVERNIELLKLGSASIGLCMAVIARNTQNGIGCSMAISESLMRFGKAGAKVRTSEP